MSDIKRAPVVDGDSPQSTTLRHLLTYPAVQDGVRVFKANALGKMSIQLSTSVYQAVAAPVLPLFNKPFSFVSPYLQRADELGNETLTMLEEKFPAVKKPSPELLVEAKEVVYAPVRHVAEVYNGAYQRNGSGDVIARSKAAVKTAALVTGESLIYAIRGALKLGESLKIHESINAKVDSLEAAITRREGGSRDNAETQSQNGLEPKKAEA